MTTEAERYTPGHSSSSVSFMAARGLETHGAFFLPYLEPGADVLDVGCGPGTITLGIAAAVAPGTVTGVDQGGEQLGIARTEAARRGLGNVRFEPGSCYAIPLPDASVDRVFANALMEHLAEPERAVAEMRRVLRPGGVAGLCSPDWGGFLLSPASPEVDAAVSAYRELQEGNGGDPLAGRRIGGYLTAQGFTGVRTDARYERYADSGHIAGYLADQLDDADPGGHGEALRAWARDPAAMFAQAWVSAVAVRPA